MVELEVPEDIRKSLDSFREKLLQAEDVDTLQDEYLDQYTGTPSFEKLVLKTNALIALYMKSRSCARTGTVPSEPVVVETSEPEVPGTSAPQPPAAEPEPTPADSV